MKNYLKWIRNYHELTREEMANKLNLNRDVYNGIERGDRPVSTKTIKKLKALFGNDFIDANKFFD